MADKIEAATVASFGQEWKTFQQSETELSAADRQAMFESYFHLFPWDSLPAGAVGADIGCGSGRWAMLVAPRVGTLHLCDASPDALAVARHNLASAPNAQFDCASVEALPFADGSLDFAYCLGVLHHVSDTVGAIAEIARKLKPGAPLLLYLYYSFENRPGWYRALWKASNLGRLIVSRSPKSLRWLASQAIAATVYWPIARTGRLLERMNRMPASWPLTYYRDRAFYVMRTDAYDRFCTPLEKRYSRAQITEMLASAGMVLERFSDREPFWVSLSRKA